MSDTERTPPVAGDETLDEKALPCPFCGDQPKVQYWHGGPKTKRMVACESEQCDVGPEVTGPTRKDAIARWNRRAALRPAPEAPTGPPPQTEAERIASLEPPVVCSNRPAPETAAPVASRTDALPPFRKADADIVRASAKRLAALDYGSLLARDLPRIADTILAFVPPAPASAPTAPDVPWREALRTWRTFWHTPYSDALILTGAQADALCDALFIPFDADEDAAPASGEQRADVTDGDVQLINANLAEVQAWGGADCAQAQSYRRILAALRARPEGETP